MSILFLTKQMKIGDEEDEDDTTPPFVHRHWSKNTKIFIYDVIDKMEQDNEAVDNLEKRKMAALIFVVGVLMANDKNCMKIKAQFITLIDNIDAFCAYPWGQESFKYSVKQLKKDIRSKCGSSNASFTFNGFIYSFEVFAYDCIPAVANRFATPIPTEDPVPRMCCWRTIKCRCAANHLRVEISNLIDGSQDIYSMLFATNEKMRTPWMVNFRPFVGRNVDQIISQSTKILDRGEHVVFGHDHLEHVSPSIDQDAPSTSEHQDAHHRVVWLENEVQAIRKQQEAMRREMALGLTS